MRWRQQEAIPPAILELECEGVLDAEVVCPVVGTSRSQVWRTNVESDINIFLTDSSKDTFSIQNKSHLHIVFAPEPYR